MYRHHEESLKIMEDYFRKRKEVIALIFGGSVAKGMERPDSDLDAMVIVPDAYYETLLEENRTAETIDGLCTYEGGYFDVKYMTKDYLRAAAERGSEPTRNSFIGSRVLFSSDPEIEGLVEAIPVFQEKEMEEKILSFYSDLMLNYNYFWKCCAPEGYMRARTASEIVYCIYRLILQENRVLFPCNRRLEETVAALETGLRTLWSCAAAFVRRWRTNLRTGSWKAIVPGPPLTTTGNLPFTSPVTVWILRNGGCIRGR